MLRYQKILNVIQEELNKNYTEYNQELQGYVNFKKLNKKLNNRLNDRRYKIKVKAGTTNTSSFIAEYRGVKFYASLNNKGWNVKLAN